MGVSNPLGVPQNRWFIMENPVKNWMIWGLPLFKETILSRHVEFPTSPGRDAWKAQGRVAVLCWPRIVVRKENHSQLRTMVLEYYLHDWAIFWVNIATYSSTMVRIWDSNIVFVPDLGVEESTSSQDPKRKTGNKTQCWMIRTHQLQRSMVHFKFTP